MAFYSTFPSASASVDPARCPSHGTSFLFRRGELSGHRSSASSLAVRAGEFPTPRTTPERELR
ncbi:hypothetical protein ZHAS_00007974 [Anopheles sinensis]|uniref:Uncharacterized protein n=1 Tax=Anopheles sinensis TaxID=74873 RepID=A0A084VR92_ANOSI|nr:hypothetical protein ZHAS_00007974 [Anopheles sinensis]